MWNLFWQMRVNAMPWHAMGAHLLWLTEIDSVSMDDSHKYHEYRWIWFHFLGYTKALYEIHFLATDICRSEEVVCNMYDDHCPCNHYHYHLNLDISRLDHFHSCSHHHSVDFANWKCTFHCWLTIDWTYHGCYPSLHSQKSVWLIRREKRRWSHYLAYFVFNKVSICDAYLRFIRDSFWKHLIYNYRNARNFINLNE